jgi:uncharacterized C2H2 Zn-finger protein
MARVAKFVKITEEGTLPANPPLHTVRDILALPQEEWPFPYLVGITQTPILRKDGSLFSTEGYDPVSCLYYLPEHGVDIPLDMPLEQAVDLLKEVISDFPFVDATSQANTLAAMLTPVLRELITGPVPMAVIDKPQQGTGASLLADVISVIATGRQAFVEVLPTERDKETELRKRVTSILIEGRQCVVIDNVEIKLKSAVLGALLTCTYWQDRILGKSELVSIPHRIVWMVTGNNIRLAGDLPRRCYIIRLDAKQARPWLRDPEDFLHPNLIEWVQENRGQLLGAIFTIARSWITAGKPIPDDLPLLGSFEDWTRTIGGILHHVGIDGFLQNLEEMYSRAEEEEGWQGFFSAWYEIFGENAVRVAEVKQALEENEDFKNALPDELDISMKNFSQRLGFELKKREGVYYPNGLYIERGKGTRKVATWRVRSSKARPKVGDVGDLRDCCRSKQKISIKYDDNIENINKIETTGTIPPNPPIPPHPNIPKIDNEGQPNRAKCELCGEVAELKEAVFGNRKLMVCPNCWEEPSEDIEEAELEDQAKQILPFIEVNFLQDIPPFVGFDGKTYSCREGDTVLLPKANAELCINRGVATLIGEEPNPEQPERIFKRCEGCGEPCKTPKDYTHHVATCEKFQRWQDSQIRKRNAEYLEGGG